MNIGRKFAVAAAFAIALMGQASADEVLYGKTLVNTLYSDEGVAIRGYDPVAYFTEGKPVKGSKEHHFDYKGATWVFASAHNRDLFAAHPEKYEPAYGGYCAFGAGNGYLVKTEPEAFTIVDGKLYLNYNVDVSKKFNADLHGRIALAEKNWPELKAKVSH
ncbi:YHS domain-containing protein [Stappia sp. F7233]|uniref:YHS domain-containing protein n=1 Tax=Stappia albiluteola TaxID=2758565 RepID=A0A839AJ74_9HYPH|nr:YHS domain-containing (seleno)protein [Stappia albiluteola]MBA5778962.1 YHS domain-containing protein [Stappia albiluteola]